VSLFSGSTGFHRTYVIDHFINHFSEWWLIGEKNTSHWGAVMSDITNEYVFQGVEGGLLTLVFFIWIISRCFRGVGLTVRGMKDASFPDKMSVWVLGAALLTHAVNFISISYFDQNIVNWYMLLAMISTVSGAYLLVKQPEDSRVPFLSEAAGGRTQPSWSVKNPVSAPSRNQFRRSQ
jgi:hypothetical protein